MIRFAMHQDKATVIGSGILDGLRTPGFIRDFDKVNSFHHASSRDCCVQAVVEKGEAPARAAKVLGSMKIPLAPYEAAMALANWRLRKVAVNSSRLGSSGI
jgi:hypothetical protein